MGSDGIIKVDVQLDDEKVLKKIKSIDELSKIALNSFMQIDEISKKTWETLIGDSLKGIMEFSSTFQILTTLFTSGENSVSSLTGALITLQMALSASSVAINFAKTAQTALNSVMTFNPFGIAIAGCTAFVTAMLYVNEITRETSTRYSEFITISDSLIKKNNEVAQSAANLIKEQENKREEYALEANVTTDIAQKIETLASKERKSVGEKKELLALVEQLNQRLPNLSLAYDEQTDSLNMSISALKNYINFSNSQILLNAAVEDRIELIKEERRQQKLLAEEEKSISKLQKSYEDILDEANTRESTGVFYIDPERESITKQIEEATTAYVEHQEALTDTQKAITDLDNEIAQYSTTLAIQEQSVTAAQEAQERQLKTQEEINSLTEEYADIATNAFDKLEQKSGVTLSSMLDNLKANQKAIQDWKSNMSILEEKDILSPDLIQYLYDLGPTYAPVIEQAIKEWGTGAREQLLELQDMLLEGIDLSKSTATQQITDENSPELVDGRIQNTGAMWQAGVSIDQQFADGMSSSDTSRQAAAEKVEQVYQTVDGRIVQNGVIMQENAGAIDAQLAEGISQGSQAETAAANKVDSMYSVVNGRIVQNGVAMPEVGIGFNEQVSSMVAQLLAPSIQLIQGTGEEIRTVLQGFLSWLESQYTVIIINWQQLLLIFRDSGIYQTTQMAEGMQAQFDRLPRMADSAGNRMMDSLSQAIEGRREQLIAQVQQVMNEVNAAMGGSSPSYGASGSAPAGGRTSGSSPVINNNFYTPTASSLSVYNATKDAMARTLYFV